MTLNELRDDAFAYAEKQGFHEKPINFAERLMLVVSELSEALEAHRKGEAFDPNARIEEGEELPNPESVGKSGDYTLFIKGSIAEEFADAIIRISDLAGIYGIDLDWHVKAKMAYNKTRPFKHGKKYG